MSIDFSAAMRRATDATRALDVNEATRLIQEALGTRPASPDAPAPDATAARASLPGISVPGAKTARAPFPGKPASDVEDAEIVDAAPRPRTLGARIRRPLGQVVNLLREGRPAMPSGGRPAPTLPIPEGASFEARSYRSPAGTRDYRLYIPASAKDGARGLVVMLHGCTQNPEDFAAGTRMNALAEAHGLLVAWPRQTAMHNANACWNWFRPEDQGRGAGEPAIIAGLAAEIVRDHAVPAGQVFVAGLSAGGAMAAVLAETYPDVFAAAGVHSGLARGSASDVVSAFAAMRGGFAPGPAPETRPRMIVFQGTADATVHPSNAANLLTRAGGDPKAELEHSRDATHRGFTRSTTRAADGTPSAELWMIDGAGHAWSGGASAGSYTDPTGPDASAAMVRFFLKKAD